MLKFLWFFYLMFLLTTSFPIEGYIFLKFSTFWRHLRNSKKLRLIGKKFDVDFSCLYICFELSCVENRVFWNDVCLAHLQCSTDQTGIPILIKLVLYTYFGLISRLFSFLVFYNLNFGGSCRKKNTKLS